MGKSLEERVAQLEQENRALRGESNDAFFTRLKQAGGADRSGLPSAAIPSSADIRESREIERVLEAAKELRLDVKGGFRSFDATREGKTDGYSSDDITRLARKLNERSAWVQTRLNQAARNLNG